MSCHSTHGGIAATRHARAVTELDDGQVASIFHRLKNAHKDDPAPTPEEAISGLTRMRREVLDDPRLTRSTATQIADRYAHAIEAVTRGEVPDGRTWAAMQSTVIEAEIAERNLNGALRASARHQRKSEERLTAAFHKWRRTSDYEDLESPEPEFILNEDRFPADKNTKRALRKLGFENHLAQKLPVFVYGTLRRNQGNDRLMNGAIAERSEDAQVSGVAVYGAEWGFPYANEAPDGQGVTKGDLVYLDDGPDGDHARQRLDNLEGFNSDHFNDSHYRRVARDVTYTDPATGETKTRKAWVYLAGNWSARDLSEADRIPDGDWVAAKDNYRRTRNTRTVYADAYDDDTTEPDAGADTGHETYSGDYVVTKRAVDSTTTAEQSASVFASAGLFDDTDGQEPVFSHR